MKPLIQSLLVIIAVGFFAPTVRAQSSQESCALVPNSGSCVDATPCKKVSGTDVCLSNVANLPAGALRTDKTCWQWNYEFACAGQKPIDTTEQYAKNPKCKEVSRVCVDKIPETGACTQYEFTYQCETQAAVTTETNTCKSGLFNVQEPPHPKSDTFSKAALAMEISRQAQLYNKQGEMIFSGVSESCKKGYFGLKNCCKTAPGASNNASLMASVLGQAAIGGIKYVGGSIIDYGSTFVFDAMYQNDIWTAGMTQMFQQEGTLNSFGTSLASNGLSVGAYGFTWTTGTAEIGSGLMGGTTVVGEVGGFGGGTLTFNPYVFAAVVALQVIQDLMSCSVSEQSLSLHRGASLSSFVREECSQRVPIVKTCIEWTSTFCSFNSVLAKIINTQGKPQLGLDVSNCAGLSMEQVGQLDFTKIDFSEFSSQMLDRAVANTPTDMKTNYTPVISTTTGGSQQGGSTVLPSYRK